MKVALYQGHGQIESYPVGSALMGVISHEQRHANFNTYSAFQKSEELKQDIKLTIQYKDGQPIPTNAYTEAKFKEKESIGKEEQFIKMLFINFKISDLEKKFGSADSKEKQDILFKIDTFKRDLKKLKEDIFAPDISKSSYTKVDHALFLNIYDFQKYNLPPVMMSGSFSSASSINEKVNDINSQKSIEQPIVYQQILNEPLYKSVVVDSWLDINSSLTHFNNYLQDFSIHFNKVKYDTDSSQYFQIIPSNENYEDRGYKISINRLAKYLTIYSDKVDDPYASLGKSGTLTINGIEVEVENSDSLYDIAQKINWGEDSNHNALLDYDEGEDTNSNETLDGGTIRHGVYAFIQNNSLFLKNIESGDIALNIEDNDNIFHDLNIIKDNPLNNLSYYPNVYENGENALVEINGELIESQSNVLSSNNDIFILKNISDVPKSADVLKDEDSAISDVKEFISNYNNLITSLNDKVMNENFDDLSADLSKIKRELKNAIFDDISYEENFSDIGGNIQNDKNYLTDLEISHSSEKNFHNSIRDGITSLRLKSNQDETLIISEDKLSDMLKDNPDSVNQIFFSENGIIDRLKTFFDKVIDGGDGMISSEISQLTNSYFSEIEDFYNQHRATINYYEEKFSQLNSIIEND